MLWVLVMWIAAAAAPLAATVRPARKVSPAPAVVNIVRTKIKPRMVRAYETQEAAIVQAYERSHVRLFWTCFQSKKDPTEILYLNFADSRDAADAWAEVYRKAIAQHPELVKMTDHLQTLAGVSTTTLTTQRDEVSFGRSDVDFETLRGLSLTRFDVLPGHEGRFVRAMRLSAARVSPWALYEATESSTFFLVAPLKSMSEGKKKPAIPHLVQELKDSYTIGESTVYAVRPAMSHLKKAERR